MLSRSDVSWFLVASLSPAECRELGGSVQGVLGPSWCLHWNSFSHPGQVRPCQGQPGRISLSRDLTLNWYPDHLCWGPGAELYVWNIGMYQIRLSRLDKVHTLYSHLGLMWGLSSSFSPLLHCPTQLHCQPLLVSSRPLLRIVIIHLHFSLVN